MMRTLLLLLLLPLMPAKAEEREIQCPGLTTYEMRFCASQSWEKSKQALKEQLEPRTLDKWKAATQEACAAAMPHTDKERFIHRWSLVAMTD